MIRRPRSGDPLDDPGRLAALADTGLLDAPPTEGMERISRLVSRLLQAPVALVSLVDARHQYFAASTGFDVEPFASLHQTPLTHSFCQHVVLTGRPLRVTNARLDPLLEHSLAVTDLGVVAYLGMPLRSPEGHVLGSLCAIDDKPRDWTADDEAALGDLAALVCDELRHRRASDENAELSRRLHEEIRRDDLTGLHNRRHWLENAPVELARAGRENRSASAVAIDLDRFKAVNDEQGHSAGDALLAALGDLWRPLIRTPDLLARWGGDEFVLLLSDADAGQARRIAERLAAAAEPMIDMTLGVAEWDRSEPVGDLLARADHELLEAKREARHVTGRGG